MSREDSLSSRFDYLFEPLDDVESIDDAPGGTSRADDRTAAPSAAPVRLAFAAFVLGTLGVVAVVAVLLLQEPNRTTDREQIPLGPLSTSVSAVSSQAVPVVPPEAPQTIEPVPEQRLPAPAAPAETGAPATRTTNSPATRAPISVAPEIRAPIPSQAPGGHGGAGLLGGGRL